MDYESWDVAGYGGGGQWEDVERGDPPLSADEPLPDWVDEMVIHFITEEGESIYVTIWGPWDDWDVVEDIVDEIDLDPYSIG